MWFAAFCSTTSLSPPLTHSMYTNRNNWYFCQWWAPLTNSDTPGAYSLSVLLCAHTQRSFHRRVGWRTPQLSTSRPAAHSSNSALPLQKQGIPWGRNVAQHPHFGTSKHHCCPGTERKTSPLPANASCRMDGFKRTHFFLTHCPHNASDFEETLPTTPFIFLTQCQNGTSIPPAVTAFLHT